MIDEIALMQRVFDRYRVSSPLPGEVQRRALRMKRKNLVAVMKKVGIYSPLYGMILAVYLFMKKIGIGLSVMQSAVVLFTASAVAVSAAAAGGYMLAGKVMVKTRVEMERGEKAAPKAEPGANSGDVSGGTSRIKYRYRLQFYGLENTGAEGPLVAQVSESMRNEIKRLKGHDTIAITPGPDGSNMVLTGSIEKLDRQYLLSIRLTDRRTRRIIFAASEESATADGLHDLAVRFAQSVAGKIQ